MYTTLKEFQAAFSDENASTLKLLRALTDASLQQPVAPGGRTLGRIAWHIVQSLGEMGSGCGLVFDAPPREAAVPTSAAEIADAYERTAAALLAAVMEQWTDASLDEERNMYGEMWKNSFTLMALGGHEIHHRGQMTVLMRQAGVPVAGVFGPSREEWAAMGLPEMP